ncbi:MAG: hypothetical protein IKA95_02170 [Clostridia bacterium]|nr:hypothetical protein [Clostridia bacterium]
MKHKYTKICPYCKTVFTTDKSARKFCRKKCSELYKSHCSPKLSKHLCQWCGHIFDASRKRKFCTKKCQGKYMRDIGLIQKTKIKVPVKITLTDAARQSKAEGVTYGTFVRLHKLK